MNTSFGTNTSAEQFMCCRLSQSDRAVMFLIFCSFHILSDKSGLLLMSRAILCRQELLLQLISTRTQNLQSAKFLNQCSHHSSRAEQQGISLPTRKKAPDIDKAWIRWETAGPPWSPPRCSLILIHGGVKLRVFSSG